MSKKTGSIYRKIETKTWADDKFIRLSKIPACGQGLFLYLMTGPFTGPIPGVFRAGRLAMAEELEWEPEAFDKAFQEVFQEGMVKADWKSKLVWLPNAIKYNLPTSPNVVRGWRLEWENLPECALKVEALKMIKSVIYGLGEPFEKAFTEAFGKECGKAFGKPLGNQEQEQEQEQSMEVDFKVFLDGNKSLLDPVDKLITTPENDDEALLVAQARLVDNRKLFGITEVKGERRGEEKTIIPVGSVISSAVNAGVG